MSDTHSAADTRPRIGEGRIGAFLCAAIGLLSVAAVLCLRVPAADFRQPSIYVGLDWMVLHLFFTGIIFALLEWVFPRVRPDQPPLRPCSANSWGATASMFWRVFSVSGLRKATSDTCAYPIG